MEILAVIHPDFSQYIASLNTDPQAAALVATYQASWGGRNEILVIMGVKLILEGEAYVLGETRLLRKLAMRRSLSPDFVCWSHNVAFPKEENPEEIEPIRLLPLGSALFETHHDAFMTLCHYLEGEGKYIPFIPPEAFYPQEEEDVIATDPVPIFPEN